MCKDICLPVTNATFISYLFYRINASNTRNKTFLNYLHVLLLRDVVLLHASEMLTLGKDFQEDKQRNFYHPISHDQSVTFNEV